MSILKSGLCQPLYQPRIGKVNLAILIPKTHSLPRPNTQRSAVKPIKLCTRSTVWRRDEGNLLQLLQQKLSRVSASYSLPVNKPPHGHSPEHLCYSCSSPHHPCLVVVRTRRLIVGCDKIQRDSLFLPSGRVQQTAAQTSNSNNNYFYQLHLWIHSQRSANSEFLCFHFKHIIV